MRVGVAAAHYRVVVEKAQQLVSSEPVSDDDADLLGVPRRSPALVVRRQGSDRKGRLVEFAVSVYRGDRYDYRFAISR